jgi:hypothetical protein
MTDVKWISIIGNAFGSRVLDKLEALDNDEITVFWFKLLSVMAIRTDSYAYTFIEFMPYTNNLLSRAFRMDEIVVGNALMVLSSLKLIETTTDPPESTGV